MVPTSVAIVRQSYGQGGCCVRVALLILALAACPCVAGEYDLWQYEQQRVQDALCDGDYQKALAIAETFEKEFKKAKKSYKSKNSWQEYEWATASSHLSIGIAERMCGNYDAAGLRFDYALKELKQIRQRNAGLADALQKQANALAYESLLEEARAYDSNSMEDFFKARVKAEAARIAAQAAADAASRVRTQNSYLITTYDALGTLAIDKALPLERGSLGSLREAQKFLGLSQEARQDRRFGFDSTMSVYGDETVSFLMSYGSLFLRRAELKRRYPDLPPVDEDIEVLLERATDYFREAEDKFSTVKTLTDDYGKLVHEGPIEDLKNKIVSDSLKANANLSAAQVKLGVGTTFLNIQKLFLGRADLDFKQAELAVLKLVHESEAGGLTTEDRVERFDEAEQRLLDASDKIKLITDSEDHPFLVICYAELAALEAIRAKMESRKPIQDYAQYLTMAEDLMKKKNLSPGTVQGVYLKKARDLWIEAEKAAG
jgi:hypothetical protein